MSLNFINMTKFWDIYIYIYINSQNLEKIQLDVNWILNFASCVLFNF